MLVDILLNISLEIHRIKFPVEAVTKMDEMRRETQAQVPALNKESRDVAGRSAKCHII